MLRLLFPNVNNIKTEHVHYFISVGRATMQSARYNNYSKMQVERNESSLYQYNSNLRIHICMHVT